MFFAGNEDINVIMWLDHRATDQTARINAMPNEVLKYVGKTMSVEMPMPKILWLKEVRKC